MDADTVHSSAICPIDSGMAWIYNYSPSAGNCGGWLENDFSKEDSGSLSLTPVGTGNCRLLSIVVRLWIHYASCHTLPLIIVVEYCNLWIHFRKGISISVSPFQILSNSTWHCIDVFIIVRRWCTLTCRTEQHANPDDTHYKTPSVSKSNVIFCTCYRTELKMCGEYGMFRQGWANKSLFLYDACEVSPFLR
jgi:hypothetical protein